MIKAYEAEGWSSWRYAIACGQYDAGRKRISVN